MLDLKGLTAAWLHRAAVRVSCSTHATTMATQAVEPLGLRNVPKPCVLADLFVLNIGVLVL